MGTQNSRFQRGSGVYKCANCGRRTRATGGDAVGVGCCEECYELAGIENGISDGHQTQEAAQPEIDRLKAEILAKGGKL